LDIRIVSRTGYENQVNGIDFYIQSEKWPIGEGSRDVEMPCMKKANKARIKRELK